MTWFQGPLWVTSGHSGPFASCPLYPQSQTLGRIKVSIWPKWGAYVLLLNEWPGGVEKFLIDGRTGPVGDRNRQSELTL
jgi:hypothetical protein